MAILDKISFFISGESKTVDSTRCKAHCFAWCDNKKINYVLWSLYVF